MQGRAQQVIYQPVLDTREQIMHVNHQHTAMEQRMQKKKLENLLKSRDSDSIPCSNECSSTLVIVICIPKRWCKRESILQFLIGAALLHHQDTLQMFIQYMSQAPVLLETVMIQHCINKTVLTRATCGGVVGGTAVSCIGGPLGASDCNAGGLIGSSGWWEIHVKLSMKSRKHRNRR